MILWERSVLQHNFYNGDQDNVISCVNFIFLYLFLFIYLFCGGGGGGDEGRRDTQLTADLKDFCQNIGTRLSDAPRSLKL